MGRDGLDQVNVESTLRSHPKSILKQRQVSNYRQGDRPRGNYHYRQATEEGSKCKDTLGQGSRTTSANLLFHIDMLPLSD
jgi:hypothetical protein